MSPSETDDNNEDVEAILNDLRDLRDGLQSGTFAKHESGQVFKQAMTVCSDEIDEIIERHS